MMLHARTITLTISVLSSLPSNYKVVFNYHEGNNENWNEHTFDEDIDYGSFEIISVFDILHDGELGQDVYKLMTDDEEEYLMDVLWEQTEE